MPQEEGFWKSLGWLEWTTIGVIAAAVIGTAAVLSPEFLAFLSSNATAAWVQAVGSVDALGAAVWLSKRAATSASSTRQAVVDDEIKHHALTWKSELEGAAQVVEQLGRHVRAVCLTIEKDSRFEGNTTYRLVRYLRTSLDATSQIPLYQMPYSVIAHATIRIRHQASTCMELLESLAPPNYHVGLNLAFPKTPEERFRIANRTVIEAMKELDGEVRQFDGYSPSISARGL